MPLMKRSLADGDRAVDGDKRFTGCELSLSYRSGKNACPFQDEGKAIRGTSQQRLERGLLYFFQP